MYVDILGTATSQFLLAYVHLCGLPRYCRIQKFLVVTVASSEAFEVKYTVWILV